MGTWFLGLWFSKRIDQFVTANSADTTDLMVIEDCVIMNDLKNMLYSKLGNKNYTNTNSGN